MPDIELFLSCSPLRFFGEGLGRGSFSDSDTTFRVTHGFRHVSPRFQQQVATIFAGMSLSRRIGLIALTIGCLAVVLGFVIYSSQQDYRLLYSGLAPEDAGAVTAKLQSRGVPFHIGSGGSSILVPADQVAQLRLDFAVEGLPAKSKGFELFDEISIGMTPFQQHRLP